MDIALNKRGGVPVRDQLVTQLELRILSGTLAPGDRLPSVRALARRLKIHHNTVSAAYKDLEDSGHVVLVRGSGVFVRQGGPTALRDARGLDEMIRLALHAAFRKGFTGGQIRAAVERWLAAAPPDRIVVIDPSREMGELIVHEISQVFPVRATAASIEEVRARPALLNGTLGIVLPYHVQTVLDIVPGAALEVVHIEPAEEERRTIMELAAGSIVLVVSHSPTVLPFATVYLRTLRGEDLLVEARLVTETRDWKRIARAADLVFADTLAFPRVRAVRKAGLREFRVVPPTAIEHIRGALSIVAPALAAS